MKYFITFSLFAATIIITSQFTSLRNYTSPSATNIQYTAAARLYRLVLFKAPTTINKNLRKTLEFKIRSTY